MDSYQGNERLLLVSENGIFAQVIESQLRNNRPVINCLHPKSAPSPTNLASPKPTCYSHLKLYQSTAKLLPCLLFPLFAVSPKSSGRQIRSPAKHTNSLHPKKTLMEKVHS